ncbi:TRAP transporter small permease subunit [Chloroflexota bacterium]
MRKILERAEKGLALVGALCVLVLMVFTSADVSGRYIFNHPLAGAYEISEVLLVGIVFLAAAYVQAQRGHIKVVLFERFLSKRTITKLEILGIVVGLCTFSIMAWQSSLFAWKAWITKEYYWGLVDLPLWPGKLAVAIGFMLLSVRLVYDMVSDLRLLRRGSLES